jgi:hypothetical protein
VSKQSITSHDHSNPVRNELCFLSEWMIIQTVLPHGLNLTFHDHSVKDVLKVGFEVYVAVIILSRSLLVCTDVFISKVAEWHILKMEVADVSETSVPICLTTWHHTPEGNADSLCRRSGNSASLPYSTLRSLVTILTKRGKLLKFNFVFDYTTRKPLKTSKRQANKCLFVQTIELCCSQWCFPLRSFVLL